MAVRRIVLAVVCLAAAVGVWLMVASAWNPDPAAKPQQAPSSTTPSAPAETDRAFTNEQEWIVWDVTSAIEVMAGFKSGVKADVRLTVRLSSEADTDVYNRASFTMTADGHPRSEPLTIVDHIWSPLTYVEFAKDRLGGAVTGDDPGTLDVLRALNTPRAHVLLEQDRLVSARLTRNMRSPSAHEDAALLLAAMALRESAGPTFSDVRQILSAMTAHLAIAHALRTGAPLSPSGFFAGVALASLVGRDAEAVARLESAAPHLATSAERAWARALRIRATRDYRLLENPREATLREQLAYAREVRLHVSDSRYLSVVREFEVEPSADWCRIAYGPMMDSVDVAHAFVETGLAAEQAEAGEVWSAFSDTPFKIVALNDAPEPGTPRLQWGAKDVHVLDWPLWAAFLQRHLAANLFAHATYYDMLAWKEQRERLASELEEPFGLLTLYPVVLRIVARTPEQYRWSLARASRIPIHLVTARAWKRLQEKPDFIEKPEMFTSDVKWFSPLVPAGTAYDLRNRSLREGCDRPAPLQQLERWAGMSPYDDWVIWSVVWRRGADMPTASEMFKAYGRLADYDIWPSYRIYTDLPMRTLADTLRATRTLCELDSDYCGEYAMALLQNGEEPRALSVYDRWIATCRDRVRVSNGVTWPVRYHLARGRHDRALEIAADARSTGSGSGMMIYAEVLEAQGRYADAEREHLNMVERYEQSWTLGAFYLRQFARTDDPTYYEKASAALKDVFPNGIERGDLALIPAPPPDGVQMIEFGRRAARTGLRPEDVIVKVENIRVHNVGQYKVAASAVDGPEMTLVVFRKRSLLTLRAKVPERWIGVKFKNYRTE
jgi:hypothetical protein